MFDIAAHSAILNFGLLLGIFVFLELGFRLGRRHKVGTGGRLLGGFGTIDGAVFGLLGLLIAFTFSSAVNRFNDRRHLILEETNAIGTAYLRLDYLSAKAQPALREDFRSYLDARLLAYSKLPDLDSAQVEFDRALAVQEQIWKKAVAATHNTSPAVTSLVAQSLNAMIDINTSRTMAMRTHLPMIIFIMLGVLVLISSLLAGYGLAQSRKRDWLHVVCYALLMAGTVFVIIDIEFPRHGFVRVDAADQVLYELRQSMK